MVYSLVFYREAGKTNRQPPEVLVLTNPAYISVRNPYIVYDYLIDCNNYFMSKEWCFVYMSWNWPRYQNLLSVSYGIFN